MKCPLCGCTDIEYNECAGHAACVQCGTVLEENTIVSSVEFQESGDRAQVVGQFVSATGSKGYGASVSRYGFSRESREATLSNARRVITQVSNGLRLPIYYAERAHRLYSLALQRNFIYGRRQMHIVATCLYIICRQEKSPHLLIDFSDSIRINVFILGRSYLKFIRVLNLKLDIVDPSLFIHRYAARLELGEKLNVVSTTALRAVTRFNKDWITTGRRPDGICAAALLIAGRSHGIDTNPAEIAEIFNISQDTIMKRLREFRATPSAQLTLDQFQTIDIELEFDPPCFIQNNLEATGKRMGLQLSTTGGKGKDGAEEAKGETGTGLDANEILGINEDEESPEFATIMIQGIEIQVPLPAPPVVVTRSKSSAREQAKRSLYEDILDDVTANSTGGVISDSLLEQEAQEVISGGTLRGWCLRRKSRIEESHQEIIIRPTATLVTATQNTSVDATIPPPPPTGSSTDSIAAAGGTATVLNTAAGGSGVTVAVAGEGCPEEIALNEDEPVLVDIDRFLLTEAEAEKRAVIWEKMHRPFMDMREQRKREREREIAARGTGRRGRGRARRSGRGEASKSAASAVDDSMKWKDKGRASKKINYEALQGVFGPDGNFVPPITMKPTSSSSSSSSNFEERPKKSSYWWRCIESETENNCYEGYTIVCGS